MKTREGGKYHTPVHHNVVALYQSFIVLSDCVTNHFRNSTIKVVTVSQGLLHCTLGQTEVGYSPSLLLHTPAVNPEI